MLLGAYELSGHNKVTEYHKITLKFFLSFIFYNVVVCHCMTNSFSDAHAFFSMQPLQIHRRVAGTFFYLCASFAVLLRNKKAAPPYHLLPVPRCINAEVYYIIFFYCILRDTRTGRTSQTCSTWHGLYQFKIIPNRHTTGFS
jgi:hypothetical protein